MNYVVGDGKSNWMEGVILMCTLHGPRVPDMLTKLPLTGLYVIIGVSFWFYPGTYSYFLHCPATVADSLWRIHLLEHPGGMHLEYPCTFLYTLQHVYTSLPN